MEQEKEIRFGWGIDDTHCEPETYESVEELLKYAQESWDNQDGNPFDSDCDYSGCIYVGTAETFEPADFAPSLDNIADQIIKQDEIMDIVSSNDNDDPRPSRQTVFDNHWLDIEDHYRKAGWKVTYDKPAYDEDYDAFFKFEMA